MLFSIRTLGKKGSPVEKIVTCEPHARALPFRIRKREQMQFTGAPLKSAEI